MGFLTLKLKETFKHSMYKLSNWDFLSFQTILQRLSCMAKENGLYLVANLLEKDASKLNDIKYHNTAIAFDRNGQLVAR